MLSLAVNIQGQLDTQENLHAHQLKMARNPWYNIVLKRALTSKYFKSATDHPQSHRLRNIQL